MLGYAFSKFVVMALGVGLICWAKVEDILVVLFHTGARSIIAKNLNHRPQ